MAIYSGVPGSCMCSVLNEACDNWTTARDSNLTFARPVRDADDAGWLKTESRHAHVPLHSASDSTMLSSDPKLKITTLPPDFGLATNVERRQNWREIRPVMYCTGRNSKPRSRGAEGCGGGVEWAYIRASFGCG